MPPVSFNKQEWNNFVVNAVLLAPTCYTGAKIGMKILAIFDTDVSSSFAPLRKLHHTIDLVTDLNGAQQMLAMKAYDVILCQPLVDESAVQILKAIRQNGEQNDVPFICCQTDALQLSSAASAEMLARILTLGGQGLIYPEIFNSKNLIHAISKCLTAAVGSPCVTSSWR